MKHIYERFEDKEHAALVRAKKIKAEELGRKRMSWHDFFLTLTDLVEA